MSKYKVRVTLQRVVVTQVEIELRHQYLLGYELDADDAELEAAVDRALAKRSKKQIEEDEAAAGWEIVGGY